MTSHSQENQTWKSQFCSSFFLSFPSSISQKVYTVYKLMICTPNECRTIRDPSTQHPKHASQSLSDRPFLRIQCLMPTKLRIFESLYHTTFESLYHVHQGSKIIRTPSSHWWVSNQPSACGRPSELTLKPFTCTRSLFFHCIISYDYALLYLLCSICSKKSS